MKLIIQRVSQASVTVDEQVIGSIGKGLMVLLGVTHEDTQQDADKLVKKLLQLRIFDDSDGKTNLSLLDVGGELLIISQFTLYADCRKGNRPNFLQAAKPEQAEQLYDYFVACCKEHVPVAAGSFGAHMKVQLINDGPFTITLP